MTVAGRDDLVLVLNTGSSSVKYRLIDVRDERVLVSGLAERVGEPIGRLRHVLHDGDEPVVFERDVAMPDHAAALDAVLRDFADHGPDIDGAYRPGVIGHRTVHGGDRFADTVVITDEVVDVLRDLCDLAPLHNPPNIVGIEVARRAFPDVPHVGVFDTAFHQTIPEHAFRYAVPAEWYERHGVRRYGFHGTSHAYVSREAARMLDRMPDEVDVIVLHLGNGASACAVSRGRSVETSMGLGPLGGLMMGTRPGDVDPALTFHLGRVAGIPVDEVERALNHDSGLQGIAGHRDMREVRRAADAGDEDARLALRMYAYRIRFHVGAYLAVMGGADAVVFTAGIGENDADIREESLAGLEGLGIVVDPERNRAGPGARFISPADADVAVMVIPTDEELEIARQAAARIACGGR